MIVANLVMRNDTTENWSAVEETAVLLKGEIGVEFAEDATKVKVGDGVTPWKDLPYVTTHTATQRAIHTWQDASAYTWGDIAEKTSAETTSVTPNLKLTKPAYADVADVAILNANADLIDRKTVELYNDISALSERLETLISSSTPPENLELLDIRNGYDGVRYDTAGDAVRSLGRDITQLKDNLSDFLGGELVDGLKYENSQLWLTSGGVTIGDPVTITGGSGSGTQDGMYVVTLTNLMDSRIISVAQGEDVVLDMKYTSSDSEGITDGAGIGTITVNSVKKATIAVAQGNNSIDITRYLSTGANSVKISVENSEGTSKILIYEVTVIALAITTTVADMDIYTGNVNLPYVLTGQGSKVVHFIMDGYELATETVTATDSSRTFYIPKQYDGGHVFEMYAEAVADGQTIRSNTLRIGMMFRSDTMTDQAVLIMHKGGSIQQGESLTIPYMCYDPFSQSMEVTLGIYSEGGMLHSEKTITIDQTPKTWVTQDYPVGKTVFRISCGNASKEIEIEVAESDFDRAILTDSLALEFNASGRNNSEANPASWTYGDISATFSGFGWAGADGWIEDANGHTVLRFLPDDFMTIPYEPFAQDFRTSGYTIEAEFATHNVRDYDSIVVTSMNGGRGFMIKSQQAELKSEQSSVSVQFKEDSKVRITFVVEQKSLSRFVYVYINGIMCGVTQYTDNDNFAQSNPVGITIGAESCGLDLYVLRIYNKGLTRHEQLNNFICDRPTLEERRELDEANDVLDDNKNVAISSLPMNIPYIILECEELPQFKGDKKKNKSVTFVDQMNPERSFTATGVQLDVQGTSSAGYPVKNYKVSLKSGLTYTNSGEASDGFPIFDGGLPGEVICLKADYASSENANNVCLVDYYEENCPYKTPPQMLDDRVRQGIRGFACCVFWQDTTTGEVKFLGKYNFNDDKSNENVFGFDREIYPNCECWEFKNNTANNVIFKEADFESVAVNEKTGEEYPAWTDDFEARFPDLDDPYQDVTQFKRLCEWLVSCNRELADSEEEKAARLQKFKNEFDRYLIKDACIFYYLFTEIFLMVDNRAKNMFLTTFDGEHWFPIPYDWDTACGINNEGELVFDYNLEDTDTVNGEDVFNGQHSALWCNVRDAFRPEITKMYQDLRSAGTLSYQTIKDKMERHQQTWPQSIWNEDAYIKWLNPYLLDGEDNLAMLQGDKAAQRDFWLFNAFKYRDSKHDAGEAKTNYITLRAYQTGDIEITPYSHIWPTIKYGSSTTAIRGYKNETYLLPCKADNLNDSETYIYSADRIASIGDLSQLKVGYAIFSDAKKLQQIIIGSEEEGYENPNFTSLTVGNNELLTLVNVCNCTNEKFSGLDLSGCYGLETLLAKGTKLTGVSLPNGGHLKHIELPGTIANFTIQNQKNLETVVFEGYDNLTTLRVEGTPGLNIEEIVLRSPILDRVRLVGVEWNATDESTLRATFDKLKNCIGMDAIGNNTALATVSGRVHISSISDTLLEEINDVFPELIVVVNGVAKFFMRYVNYDNTLLYRYICNAGENAINPITEGLIAQPVRPNTETATYEYLGWSEIPMMVQKPYNIVARFRGTYRVDFCDLAGNILDSQWINEGNAAEDPVQAGRVYKPTKQSTAQFSYEYKGWDREFNSVTTPLVLKPQFEEILRSYKCYFYNDTELIQESIVFYGSCATFVGDTEEIYKMIGGEPSPYYEFTGWSPNPDEPIKGTVYYYAQFAFDGYIDDDWLTIANAAASGDVSAYGLGGRKKMDITIAGKENSIELEIVGKDHDNLAAMTAEYNGGKNTAALTFVCKIMPGTARIMNQTLHSAPDGTSLNTGGWEVSDLRAWIRDTLFAAMPADLQQVIKPVIKISDGGFYNKVLVETVDTLWIPSCRELNAETPTSVVQGQGEPYPVYTNAESRMKQNAGGGLRTYWTRSSGRDGQHFYRYIDSQGYPNNVGASAQNLGIAFGFCI